MYCIPKIHENRTGARFFIKQKISSTKQFFKSGSDLFKLIYSNLKICINQSNSNLTIKGSEYYKIQISKLIRWMEQVKESMQSISQLQNVLFCSERCLMINVSDDILKTHWHPRSRAFVTLVIWCPGPLLEPNNV